MSTSLFVVPRIRSRRLHIRENRIYEEGTVIFTVKHKREKLHCPECGSRDLIFRGCSPRRFRMVPIGSKVIFLDLDIQRAACKRCDMVRLLPEGRPQRGMESAGQEGGGEGARRMDTEGIVLRRSHAQDHGEDPLPVKVRHPQLLRLPHLHRSIGGYQ